MRFSHILLPVPVTLTLTGQVPCSRNLRSTRAGTAGDHTLDTLDTLYHSSLVHLVCT